MVCYPYHCNNLEIVIRYIKVPDHISYNRLMQYYTQRTSH